jgi:hypothetical protein
MGKEGTNKARERERGRNKKGERNEGRNTKERNYNNTSNQMFSSLYGRK